MHVSRNKPVRAGESEWVDGETALEALAARVAGAGRLALDTEANGFHAYQARLCLVQLAWREDGGDLRVAIVDALALGGALATLQAPLEDPSHELVMHGADYDIRLLKRDAGIAPRGLFDTQVAAKLTGLPQTSLAALAQEYCGVRLDKASQRIDWAKRPLSDRALSYAADDVRVLFDIRDALADRLERTGRLDWAEEESRIIEAAAPAGNSAQDVESLMERMPGAAKLVPAQRAVLAALAEWRDREARRRDRPPGFIVPSRTLVDLARAGPRSAEQLSGAGLPPRTAGRYGNAILRAVASGRSAPARPRPRPRHAGEARPSRSFRRRLDLLRGLRNERAEALALEPSTLCSTACLKALVKAYETGGEVDVDQAGLRSWQRREIGELLIREIRSWTLSDA